MSNIQVRTWDQDKLKENKYKKNKKQSLIPNKFNVEWWDLKEGQLNNRAQTIIE